MLDPNNEYGYVIQWIEEAKNAIASRLASCQRNLDAYHHKPSKNIYKENAMKYDIDKAMASGAVDLSQRNMFCSIRDSIPDGRSDIIYRSVETNVNQLSGGMGAFQVSLYDPASVLEDGFEQKLSLAAERIYNIYGIDSFRDLAVRDMMLFGAAYIYPFYDKSINDISVERISIDKMILDPIRFQRNGARYIGFQKVISWQQLEKEVVFQGKYVKVFNDAKLEAKNIEELMLNREMHLGVIEEFETRMGKIGLPYKSNATDPASDSKKKYNGQDVEVSLIWDLTNGDRFMVLNRKYIVQHEKNALNVATSIENEINFTAIKTNILRKIKSPIIEIPYKIVADEAYPTTPLDEYVEDFDEICTLYSIKKHNEALASVITPIGSANDLAIISNLPPISGMGAYGIDGQVGFLQRGYDPSFLDSRIQQREEKIKEAFSAYSQIDMSMMIGDRASAKEASQAQGAVAAGHNALIHNLEMGFSDVLRAVNLLMVRHKSNRIIKVKINEDLATVPVEALALDAILNVKLKSEVDRQKEKMSMMASQMINLGVNNQYINQEEFVPAMLEIAFGSLLTKAQIRNMIKQPEDPEFKAFAQQQAENQAKELNLEQQIVEQDPEAAAMYKFNKLATPEDQQALISEMQAMQGGQDPTEPIAPPTEGLKMEQDNPATDLLDQKDIAKVNLEEQTMEANAEGLPPEIAGEVANGGLL